MLVHVDDLSRGLHSILAVAASACLPSNAASGRAAGASTTAVAAAVTATAATTAAASATHAAVTAAAWLASNAT